MKIEKHGLKINKKFPCFTRSSSTKRGFTLAEILVVIGIFTVIASISFYYFSVASKKEALEKDTASLTALIRNARALSVASKNASQYGIHLENNRAILFEGSSYSPGEPNQKYFNFSKNMYLHSYSLNLGGADIIFNRLTGETLNFGTITLSLIDNSASSTITILNTGVVQ